MALPVLHTRHQHSHPDLVRLFHLTESRWCGHLAEGEAMEVGTVFCNPRLSTVYNANNIHDVALPPGMDPRRAAEKVAEFFGQRGSICAYWLMNPSAPEQAKRPMVEHLLAEGYRENPADIMRLSAASLNVAEAGGLTIIPARASFRHTRMIAEQWARDWNAPELADGFMMHLDDPHWDALLALKDGEPAAYIGVLGVGEVGRIDEVYVLEPFRGRGIGQTMMGRIMELCVRSTFRHVMLSVLPENASAIHLYRKLGFEKIGQITAYFAKGPWH